MNTYLQQFRQNMWLLSTKHNRLRICRPVLMLLLVCLISFSSLLNGEETTTSPTADNVIIRLPNSALEELNLEDKSIFSMWKSSLNSG
ncbi:MAG: hypothetical protein R3C11_08130 [Planctomycetaceae bacterium]